MKAIDPRMHTAEHLLNQAVGPILGCGRCFRAHIERRKSKCDYRFRLTGSDFRDGALRLRFKIARASGKPAAGAGLDSP